MIPAAVAVSKKIMQVWHFCLCFCLRYEMENSILHPCFLSSPQEFIFRSVISFLNCPSLCLEMSFDFCEGILYIPWLLPSSSLLFVAWISIQALLSIIPVEKRECSWCNSILHCFLLLLLVVVTWLPSWKVKEWMNEEVRETSTFFLSLNHNHPLYPPPPSSSLRIHTLSPQCFFPSQLLRQYSHSLLLEERCGWSRRSEMWSHHHMSWGSQKIHGTHFIFLLYFSWLCSFLSWKNFFYFSRRNETCHKPRKLLVLHHFSRLKSLVVSTFVDSLFPYFALALFSRRDKEKDNLDSRSLHISSGRTRFVVSVPWLWFPFPSLSCPSAILGCLLQKSLKERERCRTRMFRLTAFYKHFHLHNRLLNRKRSRRRLLSLWSKDKRRRCWVNKAWSTCFTSFPGSWLLVLHYFLIHWREEDWQVIDSRDSCVREFHTQNMTVRCRKRSILHDSDKLLSFTYSWIFMQTHSLLCCVSYWWGCFNSFCSLLYLMFVENVSFTGSESDLLPAAKSLDTNSCIFRTHVFLWTPAEPFSHFLLMTLIILLFCLFLFLIFEFSFDLFSWLLLFFLFIHFVYLFRL